MSHETKALREKRGDLIKQGGQLIRDAKVASSDLTVLESAKVDELKAQARELKNDIEEGEREESA